MDTTPPSGILAKICARILELWPLKKWADVKTVVAVSGGADSVALLLALTACSKSAPDGLIAAHINHGTRGKESDEDEQFVKELAGRLGTKFDSRRLSPATELPSEAWLREQRYEALTQIANTYGARYIATAHNRDDQVETILLRLFRGTGPRGLAGIPVHRPAAPGITVIRPLLDTRREMIEQALNELGQPFRTDTSNSNTTYTRNFLRHELLPLARDRFGEHLDESIVRLASTISEEQMFIDTASSTLDSAVSSQDDRLEFNCPMLIHENDVVVRRLIVRQWNATGWPVAQMDYVHWQNLCSMIKSETGHPAINLPGNIRAERSGRLLILCRQR